jgi:hypothetical protein
MGFVYTRSWRRHHEQLFPHGSQWHADSSRAACHTIFGGAQPPTIEPEVKYVRPERIHGGERPLNEPTILVE